MKKQAHKSAVRRVALAFPTRSAHLTLVVRGVMDYAQEHGPWVFTTSGEAHDLSVATLQRWPGDGIIGVLDSAADARAARRVKVPVVTFVGSVRKPGIPRVMMDQASIGRLAAQHLLDRGFRHFAFYGLEATGYSLDRNDAFAGLLAQRGFASTSHLSPSPFSRNWRWDDQIDALCRWVRKLPTPIGIFAVNDARARMLADACAMAKRKIPEKIGILGVDDSQIHCEFGSPTLTTIACDWRLLGYETARLLDRLMQGNAPPAGDQLLAPSGVIPRESTAVTLVDHPAVARAIAFVRDHLGENFGVKALVSAAGVSRRYLETSFVRSLHRTPSEYLAGTRVEQARTMLERSDLTLTRIARDCGFSDIRQFRRTFMRLENVNPRQYRKTRKSEG